MIRRHVFPTAALAVFVAIGGSGFGHATAAEAEKPDLPTAMSIFVEKVLPLITNEAAPHVMQLLRLAEAQTETRNSESALLQSPFLENLELTAPIRERRKMTMRISNSFFGNELPGEYIVSVHTDIVVNVSLTVKEIRIRSDAENPGAVVVELPRLKTRVEVPDQPNEFFESIRFFRSEDKKKEVEIRSQLIEQAKSAALEDVESRLASWRTEIAEEIRSNLRAKFPKVRISVR